MKRGALLSIVALALTLAALAIGSTLDQSDGHWLEVEKRDLVLGVDIEGELEAVDSATLGPPSVPGVWQYKISFLATEGSTVAAGQPVVGFDTTQLVTQLEQLQSARESAAAELDKTKADLRQEESDLQLRLAEAESKLRKATFALEVPEEITARNELEISRIDHHLAELEIEHLRSDLENLATRRANEIDRLTGARDLAASKVKNLQEAMQAMTVRAPRSGTVVLEADWRGDKPKVGDQTWRGRKVLEIPDLERLRATVDVAEADIGRVRPGQSVTFQLDAYPDLEFRATVSRIRTAVQPRSPSDPRKVVKAMLELESTDRERMRPGMHLRGVIEIERLPDRLAVPEEAIFADTEGSFVWVQTLLGRDRRSPELGRRDDHYFEVLDGLDAGDYVLGRERAP